MKPGLRLRIALTMLIAFGALSITPAQSTKSANDPQTEKVDALFAQWNKPDSPGCAVAIIKDGRVVYKRGYGSANLDYDIPISSKTVFNVGSVSKQFTAISVALLARQGKVSLDDDIRKYLPEIRQYSAPVTIRGLIYHTSGIREYSHLMQLAGMRFEDAAADEIYKIIARQKELNFDPGDEYLYSNSGYFLLARIVQRVSGKSLREFAQENIFKPLGMGSTRFQNDQSEVIRDRATGYSSRTTGGFAVQTTISEAVGAGGLLTAIDDLVLWERVFDQNSLPGGPAFIREALTRGTLNSGEKIDYGFGMDIETYRGLNEFGHGGATNGFNADMVRFPDQRFTVVCLCNLSNIESGRLTRQVADIYLAGEFKAESNTNGLPEPRVVQVSDQELAAVAGSYFNFANNNFRRLYVKNGKLIYSRGASESELAPLGNKRFLMLGVPDRIEISFKSPRAGAPLQMFTAANGKVFIVHDAVKPASYTPPQLKEFSGTFYSDDIEATYTITLKDDKLVLQRKNVDGETPLLGQFADAFSAAGTGGIRFTRDVQNHVNGLLLTTGRVRNLRFVRIQRSHSNPLPFN
ncbi:MAG TPA: serine hydrolase domain-containing protein [Pyrinomonadaceae bacterium]|nr:serine hydrolase domain-containing protein [Pyrinomonadaceae bacterium]